MLYSSLFPNRNQASDSYRYVEALSMQIRHRPFPHHKSTVVYAHLKNCACWGVTTTAPSKTLADTVENGVGCKQLYHSTQISPAFTVLTSTHDIPPPTLLSLDTCADLKLNIRPICGPIWSFNCDLDLWPVIKKESKSFPGHGQTMFCWVMLLSKMSTQLNFWDVKYMYVFDIRLSDLAKVAEEHRNAPVPYLPPSSPLALIFLPRICTCFPVVRLYSWYIRTCFRLTSSRVWFSMYMRKSAELWCDS